MNKTDVKYKAIETLVGKDLGKEIDAFLRGDIELVGLQISRENDKKVAMIKYVDRDVVKEKYKANGGTLEEYMYGNYYHTVEISVNRTGDLAEAMNKVLANDNDIEVMSEYYFAGNETKNAIILYASRSQVEANENAAKEAQMAMAQAKAEELAKSAVKEPDIEEGQKVLDKYSEMSEEPVTITVPEEDSVSISNIQLADTTESETTITDNKKTDKKNHKRNR